MLINIKWLGIAFILGTVEGLIEFIPISSTAHMILITSFINITDEKIKNLQIIIQLGSVLTGIIILRQKITNLDKINYHNIKHITKKFDNNHLCINHILLGTLPTIIFGFIFYKNIKHIFCIHYIIYSLIAGGILLLIAEWIKPKIPCTIYVNNLTYLQVFLIGCFQCLALWPGFSRSAATISGGLIVGATKRVALEFSLILSVPIILSAIILDLYKNYTSFCWREDVLIFSIGIVTAFVISLCTIRGFLYVINHISLVPFAIYRFILAAIIYLILI